MSERLRTALFAAVLCFVCSLLVTAASSGLKRFQNKNLYVDKQKNILLSVGLLDSEVKYTASEIDTIYRKNMKSFLIDSAGRILPASESPEEGTLPIYLYIKDDACIESYVVPIDSRGLWGRILGYLSIKSDGSSISGFTVYKHAETPGLGGEIEQKWFQQNFVGKKIVDRNGEFVSIAIAKGGVKDRIAEDKQINYVDGISGATLTGQFLTAGLKEVLSGYEPISIKFRKNQVKGCLKIEDNQNPDL